MKLALSLAAALLASTVLAACSTPCEELAAEICSCEDSRSARDACERRAQQQADANEPSNAEQNRCERLLDTCDCFTLDTAAGKRACGLAE